MKLSESENYINCIVSKISGDLASARSLIDKCLNTAELIAEPAGHAYLLKIRGDIMFEAGCVEDAVDSYVKAQAADPQSLLTRLFFAKFLATKLHDHKAAITKCDEIILLAKTHPPDQAHDISREKYIEMAETLKATLNKEP
jgi:predicted Zn-dependent protease